MGSEPAYAEMQRKTSGELPQVLLNGRLLSSGEVLGIQGPPPSWRRSVPLLLCSWIGLLLAISNAVAGIITIFLAPALLIWLHRQRANAMGVCSRCSGLS